MADPEKMKQGQTYEDSTQEDIEEVSTKSPRKSKLVLFGIAGAVVVIIVFAVIWSFIPKQEPIDEPIIDDPAIEQEVEFTFEYLPEEIADMRAYGYTADEIEQAKEIQKPADVMIEEAKAAMEAKQKEVMDKLMDAATPEYKQLMAMTWLGGKDIKITALPEEEAENYSVSTTKDNVDYVKVPAKGNQLFIRLSLQDGTYAFMTVLPSRWVTLKDSGNIVIEYEVADYNGTPVITNIQEVPQ